MPVAESELLHAFREAVEGGHQAWNQGDVKKAYATLPDELEYHLSPTWPEARVLRSRDEVIAFFEEFQETFPDVRTTDRRYLEGPGEALIVGFLVTGSGRSSGIETETEIWQVWRVSEELVPTSVREFTSRQEALVAAGVPESEAWKSE